MKTRDKIKTALLETPQTRRHLSTTLGIAFEAVNMAVFRMKKDGELDFGETVEGKYRMPPSNKITLTDKGRETLFNKYPELNPEEPADEQNRERIRVR